MILITGGSGKIGRPLARRLAGLGRPVRVLARTAVELGPGIEAVAGDITDPAACARAVAGATGVVHLAATVTEGDPADAQLMQELRRVNVHATASLARAAREAGAGVFVHVSSAAVWGYATGVFSEDTPAVPHTAYGLSKLEGERAAAEALAGSPVRLAIVRPTLVAAGAGSRHDVLAEMVKLAQRGLFPLPRSGRSARKALVAVADLVEGLVLALDRGAGLFVVSGPSFSNAELLDALARRLGRRTSWPAPLPLLETAAWIGDHVLAPLGLPAPIGARRLTKLLRDQTFTSVRAAELGFVPQVTALDELLSPYFPAPA